MESLNAKRTLGSSFIAASVSLLAVLATACGTSGSSDTVVANETTTADTNGSVTATTPITISPAAVSLAYSQPQTFSAAGGVPPYSYSIYTGGGSFNGAVYTAPSTSGLAFVEAVDSAGNVANAIITIAPTVSAAANTLTLTPSSYSVNLGDTVMVTAAGGLAPYTYILTNGTGILSGSTFVASSAGNVTIAVIDSDNNITSTMFTVNPPYVPTYSCTCPFPVPDSGRFGACAGATVSLANVTTNFGTWGGSEITCTTDLGYMTQACYYHDHVQYGAATPENGFEPDTGTGILEMGYWRCTQTN